MTKPSDIKLILSLASEPGSSGYKMHNAGYKYLNLNYIYLPRLFLGNIKDAIESIRHLNIHGSSITMPYKIDASKYVDRLSKEAQIIGSINTIVNKKGILYGYNTDAPASIKLIKDSFENKLFNGFHIIGSGGMARTFAYISKKLNLKSQITSKDKQKGLTIANQFDLEFLDFNSLSMVKNKIICNATPMCMNYQKNNIFDSIKQLNIENNFGVFDPVISDNNTWFVKECIQYNLPYVNGKQLSIEQAYLQFELYTENKIPKFILENALE